MPELRVFDRITRQMQRLGYLKRLVRRVTATSTSNLDNLGHDLIDTVTRKVRIPLNEERANYIKIRLYDRVYASLKKQTNGWLKNGSDIQPPEVMMELQDLYLADSTLPSGVGKLVKGDWDKYPPLAINLGLIRSGSYSANTRALSLLHFTSIDDQKAFLDYLPEINPLMLNQEQKLLLLYSFLENDGEVIAPLLFKLLDFGTSKFNDREVGDLLPEIYQEIISRHRTRILSVDLRERLAALEKSADSIARQRDVERYAGGTSREHASRVRVEPYTDLGLFYKTERLRYKYTNSPVGLVWSRALENVETSQDVGKFLETRYFITSATAWEIQAQPIFEPDEVVPHLYNAWRVIASPGGYAPIEELSLVAGIDGLLDHQVIIEPAVAREALISYQKANPYHVRFTVNRMGLLAHARFLEAPASI